jgi:hypothetical protein
MDNPGPSNSSSLVPLISCIILAIISAFSLKRRLANSKFTSSLPPGPKGLPWLGPVAQIPQREEWKTFRRWCLEYSMFVFRLYFQPKRLTRADSFTTGRIAARFFHCSKSVSDRRRHARAGGRVIRTTFSHILEQVLLTCDT